MPRRVQVWASYSPAKNSPEEARAKAADSAPTHSATQAELDVYTCNAKMLSKLGAALEGPEPVEFNGLRLALGPPLVFTPEFSLSLADLPVRSVPPCRPRRS